MNCGGPVSLTFTIIKLRHRPFRSDIKMFLDKQLDMINGRSLAVNIKIYMGYPGHELDRSE